MLENVFAILVSTPEKLSRELRDLSPREMKNRPAPGKWSVREILAHLADVEQFGMRDRVEAIVAEERPVLEPFEQEKRIIELRYEHIDPRKSLASLTRQRRANVRWLRKLRPAQLQILEVKRCALFPEMGNMRKFYQVGQ